MYTSTFVNEYILHMICFALSIESMIYVLLFCPRNRVHNQLIITACALNNPQVIASLYIREVSAIEQNRENVKEKQLA